MECNKEFILHSTQYCHNSFDSVNEAFNHCIKHQRELQCTGVLYLIYCTATPFEVENKYWLLTSEFNFTKFCIFTKLMQVGICTGPYELTALAQ